MMVIPGAASSFFVPPGFGGLPVGAVTAFAGALGAPQSATSAGSTDSTGTSAATTAAAFTTDPLEAWGWMYCDGRSLKSVDYPELFAVLGYVYGGAGAQFNIPDYRGYFLRGVGTGTQNDPDISARTAPPGGQGASDGVGSIQPCALQVHEHTYNSAPAPSAPSASGTAAGAPSVATTLTTGGPVAGAGQTQPVLVSAGETRPLNVYVNYIIKFTYGLAPLMG